MERHPWQRLHGWCGMRRLPRQHFIEQTRQRVLITPRIDVMLAAGLLGTHVRRRPERHSGLGQTRPARATGSPRDAEVGDHGLTVGQQYIFRLDVAVDHALPMGVVECASDFAGNAQRFAHRQLTLTLESSSQRFAFDIRHHIKQQAIGRTGVDQSEDMRMLQVCRDLNFREESLATDNRAEFRRQQFDRNRATMAEIVREKDRRHAWT